MKFITFMAEFFQDQDGGSSSKRIAAYTLLIYLGMLVNGTLQGTTIDLNTWLVIAGLLALALGLITTEFITEFNKKSNKDTDVK